MLKISINLVYYADCFLKFSQNYDTLASNDIPYFLMLGFIYSTNQQTKPMRVKTRPLWEILADISVYLTVLHMIGQSRDVVRC